MRKYLIIIMLILAFSLALFLTLYNIYHVDKIDLNTATQEELMTIPEIGEILSLRIIYGRPYRSIEQLDSIKGIGPKTMIILREKVKL